MSSIPTLAEMIINSLDYGKLLKEKLEERNLGHILKLLIDRSDVTISQLFTFNNREQIENVIQEEINDNKKINIKIKTKDKKRFANIVMEIKTQSLYYKQHQIPEISDNDHDLNKMTHAQPHYPPNPHFTLNYDDVRTPSPIPDLNFPVNDLVVDPIDPFPSYQHQPLSQPLSQFELNDNITKQQSTSSNEIQIIKNQSDDDKNYDQSDLCDNKIKITQITKENTLTTAKAKDNNTNTNSNTSSPASSHSKNKIKKIKIATKTKTNIHPQQPYDNIDDINFDLEDKEDINPFFSDMAPTVTTTNNNTIQSNNTYDYSQQSPKNTINTMNTHPQHQHYNQKHYNPPTPKDNVYNYWGQSSHQVSGTPHGTPKINDQMLVETTLRSVAYFADKLDSLHNEYRRCYSEQQSVYSKLQLLDVNKMDPVEYKRQYEPLHYSYYSYSTKLQDLINVIYTHFIKMKQQLDYRYEFQLTINAKNHFNRFQAYYDQFQSTQQNLLTVGQQQLAQQQYYYRQQQQQRTLGGHHQQQQPSRQVQPQQQTYPPTPSNYQNIVKQSFQNINHNDDQKLSYQQSYYKQQSNSITPRSHHKSPGHRYSHQSHQPRSYSTTALNSNTKHFGFGFHAQQQAQRQYNNNGNQNIPSTTRVSNMNMNRNHQIMNSNIHNNNGNGNGFNNNNNNGNGNGNGKNKNGVSIPQMGYVYIGSRMSQLISHIGLSENETKANKTRIVGIITKILTAHPTKAFDKFDIVTYGSSEHKLFIKEYSDFDFCIRSKNIKISHIDAINYINQKLTEKTSLFNQIEIISEQDNNAIHGGKKKHIKFYDITSSRFIDLVLNNLPEIGSSRFIQAYGSIDPRFASVCRVVKYWARQRQINDPLNGTLSTYALVLMVINFLQSRRLLPTLSIMVYDRETGLSPWSTQDDYSINEQKCKDFAAKNEEPHSRLLVNFFHFYGLKFNYKKDLVSVRTGTCLMKSDKKWKSINDKNYLCVENPFDSRTNLTENINEKNLNNIRNEFIRAYRILCESYKIYDVCKKE